MIAGFFEAIGRIVIVLSATSNVPASATNGPQVARNSSAVAVAGAVMIRQGLLRLNFHPGVVLSGKDGQVGERFRKRDGPGSRTGDRQLHGLPHALN